MDADLLQWPAAQPLRGRGQARCRRRHGAALRIARCPQAGAPAPNSRDARTSWRQGEGGDAGDRARA